MKTWLLLLVVECVMVILYTGSIYYIDGFSSATFLTKLSSLTISSDSETSYPVNLHNLARFIDRLQQGLPVHVTAIGGSNIQGHIKVQSNNLLNVFTEWLNEKFPVNTSRMYREVSELRMRRLSYKVRFTHASDNRAVGGTRSAMASYCFDRLIPPCDEHVYRKHGVSEETNCVVPDLLLIDFAVNDFIIGNDVTSFNPSVNMERLIRQSLTALPHTAIILTHFASWQRGAMLNAELLYQGVAQYYHVPEISVRKFQEQFLYQKDYLKSEPWAIQPNEKERVLPNRISLPLPQFLHELTPANVTFDDGIYDNAFHLNGYGHLLLTSLLTKKVLQWSSNYKNNNKASLANPLLIPELHDHGHSMNQLPRILSRPRSPLAAPLTTELAALVGALHYSCAVMYHPYNPAAHKQNLSEAELYIGIKENNGWLYGHLSMDVDKYTFYISDTNTLGQSLIIDVTGSGLVNVNTLVVAYVRSWNSSMMGSVECWLSCEIKADSPTTNRITPKQTLNGTWLLPSTQADSTQIWPLGNQYMLQNDYARYCALRYLHIVHIAKGDFRLIGLMYA